MKTRLLWEQWKTRIPIQEQEEIRRQIGEKILKENEELFQEKYSLQEILEEFQDQTEEKKTLKNNLSVRDGQIFDTLIERNRHLILQMNTSSHGRKKIGDMKNRSSRMRRIIEYILDPPEQMPRTPRTPSRIFNSDTITVEEMKQFLTFERICEVLDRIRDLLFRENEELKDEIAYFERCLDEEVEYNSKALLHHPTLAELKEIEETLSKFSDLQIEPSHTPNAQTTRLSRRPPSASGRNVRLPPLKHHGKSRPNSSDMNKPTKLSRLRPHSSLALSNNKNSGKNTFN
eukprot:gb/GECH01000572.1/.p1 GENE.gb/GECH01000572.1/~~gb/GECH01000572.1/.p1  ORF type:complete len:288 (+),score=79.81 gb/GECH01000572.1/:1-864(+)